jgi:hypothetical protein
LGQQTKTYTGDVIVVNAADIAWARNIENATGHVKFDGTALTAISGLTNLKTVGGDFSIYNNPQLTAVTGLTGLTTVTGFANIQSNGSLTSVNGLAALTTVNGYLQIYQNAALQTLGLTNLTTVGKQVYFYNCDALTNLNSLTKLVSIGTTTSEGLTIQSMNGLNNIGALVKVAQGGTGVLTNLAGNVSITSNTALSNCQITGLQTSLTAGGWARTFQHSGNYACPKACTGLVCPP